MKQIKKTTFLIGIMVILSTFSLVGCQKADPVAKYYEDVVKIAKIDAVFKDSTEKFAAANEAYQAAITANTTVDAAVLAENINGAIKVLEEGKKRVEALNIEDPKAKEYNNNLLDGINNQISGYQDMLQGMVNSDMTLIDSGSAKITKSAEDINKWMAGSTGK